MSENEGQVQQPAGQPTKTFSDTFNEGWSKYEEEMRVAKEPVKSPPQTEEECPGCEKERRAKEAAAQKETRTPYKILKVQGKEVPVYSEQELIDMAQMGVDYTKKRQSDSEDRKRWEGDFGDRADKLAGLEQKFNQLWDKLQGKAESPAEAVRQQVVSSPEQDKAKLYEQYGIDDFTEPATKKMVDEVYALKQTITALDQKTRQAEAQSKLLMLRDALGNLKQVITEARGQYPFEEYFDDNGENLTSKQYISLLQSKAQAAPNRPLPELAVEAVKELHSMQKQAKGNTKPLEDILKMSPDAIKSQFPEVYSKLAEHFRPQAVADYETERQKVPPSLSQKRPEVDLAHAGQEKKYDTWQDWLNAGMKDPEVLAGMRGG